MSIHRYLPQQYADSLRYYPKSNRQKVFVYGFRIHNVYLLINPCEKIWARNLMYTGKPKILNEILLEEELQEDMKFSS